jgi:hypothetical protein
MWGRGMRGMRGMRAWLLAAALLAALAGGARAQCNYTLALPAGSAPALNASLPATGWCAPFSATSSVPTYTCGGVSVPAGGMLAFGTCALPGAACTGATNLILKRDVDGATLGLPLNRVSPTSAVAKLSQGCVLGARCSYGAAGAWGRRQPKCSRAHALDLAARAQASGATPGWRPRACPSRRNVTATASAAAWWRGGWAAMRRG